MKNPTRSRIGGCSARRAIRAAPDFDMLPGLTNSLPLVDGSVEVNERVLEQARHLLSQYQEPTLDVAKNKALWRI